MMIYRYLSAEHALTAIQEYRMKVGRFDNLNDIFDCKPKLVASEKSRAEDLRIAYETAKRISSGMGLICYCGTAENLLLWSHYADKHSGIALGFDYPETNGVTIHQNGNYVSLKPIEYVEDNKRQAVDLRKIQGIMPHNQPEKFADAIGNTYTYKGKDWKYEEEYRQFIDLNKCTIEGTLYFWPFFPQTLKRVVLGARCAVDPAVIAASIKRAGGTRLLAEGGIEIFRCNVDDDEFKLRLDPA